MGRITGMCSQMIVMRVILKEKINLRKLPPNKNQRSNQPQNLLQMTNQLPLIQTKIQTMKNQRWKVTP